MNVEIEKLKADGFAGFLTVSELMMSCRTVPSQPGTYVVLRNAVDKPTFVYDWGGGFHDGKNINYSVEKLSANWLDGVSLLYIGKSVDLRKRVRQYMSYGKGKDSPHRGGRSIWQLTDSKDLILAWKITAPDVNPETVERNMLNEFKEQHNCLPFANMV